MGTSFVRIEGEGLGPQGMKITLDEVPLDWVQKAQVTIEHDQVNRVYLQLCGVALAFDAEIASTSIVDFDHFRQKLETLGYSIERIEK